MQKILFNRVAAFLEGNNRGLVKQTLNVTEKEIGDLVTGLRSLANGQGGGRGIDDVLAAMDADDAIDIGKKALRLLAQTDRDAMDRCQELRREVLDILGDTFIAVDTGRLGIALS